MGSETNVERRMPTGEGVMVILMVSSISAAENDQHIRSSPLS